MRLAVRVCAAVCTFIVAVIFLCAVLPNPFCEVFQESLPNLLDDAPKAERALQIYLKDKYGWDEQEYSIEFMRPVWLEAHSGLDLLPAYIGLYKCALVYKNTSFTALVDPDLIDTDYPSGGFCGGDDLQVGTVLDALSEDVKQHCVLQGYRVKEVELSLETNLLGEWQSTTLRSVDFLPTLTYACYDANNPALSIMCGRLCALGAVQTKGGTTYASVSVRAVLYDCGNDLAVQSSIEELFNEYQLRCGGSISTEVMIEHESS